MKLRYAVIAVLAVSTPFLKAQIITTGAIVGTVTDPSGLVVPDATVSVRNLGTNFTREVTTNNQGDYRIDFLNPGCTVSLSAMRVSSLPPYLR